MSIKVSARFIFLFLCLGFLSILAFHEREGSISHHLKSISGEWIGAEGVLKLQCSYQKGIRVGECKVSFSESAEVEELWIPYVGREGSSIVLLPGNESHIFSSDHKSSHVVLYSDVRSLTAIVGSKNFLFHPLSRSTFRLIQNNGMYFLYLCCILSFGLIGQQWVRKESGQISSRLITRSEFRKKCV